ncbi:hypothetical protein PAHAL_2G213100 [Panicum hallii]|uniref:Uncharacterized protein n=1 Tax=Panicum hallii TaxID=206008 RepID=A0A2T8KPX2_9POAL|nr:hypothetical protein PAHAL_2G213100 [Panicum hallii]
MWGASLNFSSFSLLLQGVMDLGFGSWGHWLLGCGLHRRSPAQIAGLKITDKFSKTAIAGLLLWFNTPVAALLLLFSKW